MAENLILPSGSGGLLRYYKEYKSKIQISPYHVLGLIIATIIFVLALKIVFPV